MYYKHNFGISLPVCSQTPQTDQKEMQSKTLKLWLFNNLSDPLESNIVYPFLTIPYSPISSKCYDLSKKDVLPASLGIN